jgi:oligosaccharide repeat unit polymerase
MKSKAPSWLLNNVVSPYGLAAISYAFFLIACLIPPSLYSHYMQEPDLMFLDPATILFYSLCVASFVAGLMLVDWLFPASFSDPGLTTRIGPALFLLIPLALGIAANALSIYLLMKQVPNIILLLISQQGEDLKETLALYVEGNFALAPLLLTGITWWALSRYSGLHLRGWRKMIVICFLVIAILSVIISSALTLIRSLLMLIVCSLAILYVLRRTVKKRVSGRFILGGGVAIVLSICLLFSAFSFLRGSNNLADQLNLIMGYTGASYNRLAGIVNGTVRYPYGGHGMYLSTVITHTHRLPFNRALNPPDGSEVWGSEFGAVSQAGLGGDLIWSGAFGDIFTDLGWFAAPFVFAYGVLYGVVWHWMKRGNVFGLVLYPFFGFCILFWLGTNYLLDTPMEFLLLAAILLFLYELLLLKHSKHATLIESPCA